MNRNMLFLLIFILTGCVINPTKPMDIPYHGNLPKQNIPQTNMASITFEKAIASIKTGTLIAHYPTDWAFENPDIACNETPLESNTFDWDAGKTGMSGWNSELGRIFYKVMKSEGFPVAGDPSDMFKAEEKRMGSDFLVGADITTINANLCDADKKDFRGVLPVIYTPVRMNKQAGEMYIEVNWTVFDPASKKRVGDFTSKGYAKRTVPATAGVVALLNDAFENATVNLAATPGFVQLLSTTDREAVRRQDLAKYERLIIAGPPKSKNAVSEITNRLTRGTVTLRSALGFGSGFIISSDGYILTAAHVVGQAEKLTVKFDNGLELPASVVRSNELRDAALLKVEVGGLAPVSIEAADALKILDEVYAIGSPYAEDLKNTVTKGVVSAFRKMDDSSGLVYIQSDVGISGGNSGGPLVNASGDVVGIAVRGISTDHLNTGLNFFVPIADALKYLNIEVTQAEAAK